MAVRRLFVDTSAWDALADSGDPHHETALLFRNDIAGNCKLLVTNYIFDELYTLLLMNLGYQQTIHFKRQLEMLIENNLLQVVWVSKELETEAWTIFEQFNADKCWSFTDCVSYAVMRQLGIYEVFAFDRHFEQMGFVRLP